MSKIATREAYGNTLAQLVKEDDHIIVLDADLSKSTKTCEAKKANPAKHINIGIAEGNMMSIAAGLSTCGNTVFASTFAIFAAGRAFEQIRNSICYPRLNVKICATHAGITVGEDGASHQAIEDLAIMRSLPNMTVISPCDSVETEAVIKAVAKYDGPCYVRLGRLAVETINSKNYSFELGKGVILEEGDDVAIIATGFMVQQALKASHVLRKQEINAYVVNIHTIKPIDKELIINLAKKSKLIVTCEEHNVIGGLGSAVSEVLSQYEPVKLAMVGINDTFGESGKPDALIKKYGLSVEHIVNTVKYNL
ncbi:transketolase family protein [Clostridium niameyense]|uniref:Transketolase family protein n=1 Tax=Clostridium niameyense TaxID=1622073 RepID=A0A6M0RAH6_9CLOT|nr:transketolase family protein [Clostridium niameyense]NEZ46757.1 transketolase family protein [Clostridium niameyense]